MPKAAAKPTELTLDDPAIILVGGLPGSGKTTFCKQYLAAAHIPIVSSDKIRAEIGADFLNSDDNKRVFSIAVSRIAQSAADKQSIALDSQALFPQHRKKYADIAHRNQIHSYFILLDTPLEVCMTRQSARGHGEPIERMKQYEIGLIETRAAVVSGRLAHSEKFSGAFSFTPAQLQGLARVHIG